MSTTAIGASRKTRWRVCEPLERRLLMTVGDLDPSYGSNGRIVTSFDGYTGLTVASDVAVQLDGSTIAVGTADKNVDAEFAITRYLPDGTLDDSFNGDGRVIVSPTKLLHGANAAARPEHATSIAVRRDGRIVVGGYVEGFDGPYWAVVQVKPDGSIDASFGQNGAAVDPVQGGSLLADLAIDDQDRVVFTGYTDASMLVARLTPTGALDPTFNGSGSIAVDFPNERYAQGTGVDVRPDGKIVVGGFVALENSNQAEFALARLQSNGFLDAGFGSSGRVLTSVGERLGMPERVDLLQSLTIGSDGRIWAAGTLDNQLNPTWAVARFQPDGSLDPTFGKNGAGCAAVFKSGNSYLSGITLEADGKAILIGSAQFDGPGGGNHYKMVVERLYAYNGAIDTSFGGGNGYVTVDFPGTAESGGTAAGVFADGDILAVGNAGTNGIFNFALARLQGDSPLILFDDVYVSGSAWSDGFRDRLAAEGKGSARFGYRIDPLKDAFNALPWTDSDELQFRIQTATADLQSAETLASRVHVAVDGVQQQIVSAAFGPDDDSHQVLRVRFAVPFRSGHMRVRFDGAQDDAGDPLDIAIPNLSGDITLDNGGPGDGVVNASDLVRVRNRVGRSAAHPGAGSDAYVTTVDLNADGVVNAADLVQERNRVGSSISANLVVNGGFEQPDFNDVYRVLGPGDANLPGWTIDGAGIGHIGSYWQASEGKQSVELNLFAAGGISQYVPTQPGKQYRISFDMAGQPNAGPELKRAQVFWEGSLVKTETFSTHFATLSNMGWSHREIMVTATGTSAALRFFGSEPANVDGGAALDNVSVVPIDGSALKAAIAPALQRAINLFKAAPRKRSIIDDLLQ